MSQPVFHASELALEKVRRVRTIGEQRCSLQPGYEINSQVACLFTFPNGEQGLAGKRTMVNIFQDTLTLEYGEQPLSSYSVEWQPDERHLLRVGNPRLYDHPYQSPQLPLWEKGEVEWYVIIRTDPPVRRRKNRGRIILIQHPLWANVSQG